MWVFHVMTHLYTVKASHPVLHDVLLEAVCNGRSNVLTAVRNKGKPDIGLLVTQIRNTLFSEYSAAEPKLTVKNTFNTKLKQTLYCFLVMFY